MELHTKLRALSAVARQQAEELTVWRLTSQIPPLFDLSNTENPSVNQDQISGVSQSQSDQYQTEEGLTLGVLESHGKVTVARTDELLLSCSSNKLQGYILNSRWYFYLYIYIYAIKYSAVRLFTVLLFFFQIVYF